MLCTLLRRLDSGGGYVHLIFVLAVATISRWTEGYFWGIFSAVSGVLFVNYVFTYPYWEFNFTITGYPFTFLAMLTVSMMISAMNTQIKKQEKLRLETEKEAVRANLLRDRQHKNEVDVAAAVVESAQQCAEDRRDCQNCHGEQKIVKMAQVLGLCFHIAALSRLIIGAEKASAYYPHLLYHTSR